MTKRFTAEEAHGRKLLAMKRWRDSHAEHRRAYAEERAAGTLPRPRGRPATGQSAGPEYMRQWREANHLHLREYAGRPEVLQRRRECYRARRDRSDAPALAD